MNIKAVFLDREGVITPKLQKGEFLLKEEQVTINPNAVEGLKKLQDRKLALFIVSNQSCISRGMITAEEAERLHSLILKKLADEGIAIVDSRICGHVDADACECRKPKPGMILDLCKLHDISPTETVMIGDSEIDLKAGQNADCAASVYISADQNSSHEYSFENLSCAADWILENGLTKMQTKQTSGSISKTKIVLLEHLPEKLALLRGQGKKIVLCHGCFDLLHPGHARYFEAAKKEGDVLIVTLTADRYVNKGPGRPAFPEHLRAEFIAAMGCVDFVAISDYPKAIEAIRTIRPDVYAKGSEYEKLEEDITGGIIVEKEAVEAAGGRIHFTHEITFSSSKLLNQHFQVFPEETMIFLREFKQKYAAADIQAALDKVRNMKVLLIGDAVIDEYHYVRPMGKTSKASVIANRFLSSESFAGGIFACANHLAGFCDNVHLVTGLGTLDTKESFINEHLKPNITKKIIYRHDAPTTVKRRYVDANFISKLFEVYYFEDKEMVQEQEKEIYDYLDRILPEYDAVVVLDYAHGLLSDNTIRLLARKARFLAVNTQTNAANIGYNPITKYPRADFVCIDEPELRLATRDRFNQIEPLFENVMLKLSATRGIVTRGFKGCTASENNAFYSVPVLSHKVVDAVGAGDAFLSIASPLVAAGLPMELVGFIGNAVGALAVTIVGNRESVEPVALQKFIKTLLA